MELSLEMIERGGLLGLLVFIIVSGARGLWVFGYQYKAAVEDRNEWKRIALASTDLAETAAESAQATRRPQRGADK